MTSQLKTFLLLALLSGLILFMGRIFGGSTGLVIALGIALVMNVGSYWFSDKIVLAAYKAREVAPEESLMLHKMVGELAREAGIPKPRVCVIPDDSPNAFATGRNPEHAVVAVTQGIMRILTPEELRGVLAHEMGHVVNRDILIQSVASVLATVVMYLANMLQFAAIFGGGRRDGEGGGGAFGMVGALLMAFLAPIAASLIQFALSRSREYLADATGARLSHSPQALASALAKLDASSRRIPLRDATPQTANMFIVNPFAGLKGGVTSLFTTHPPIQDRIARLQDMARSGHYSV